MSKTKILRLGIAQNDNAVRTSKTVLEEALATKRIDMAALVNAFRDKNYEEINGILMDILTDIVRKKYDGVPQILYKIARNICDDRFCRAKTPTHKETAAQILMCQAIEKKDKFAIGELLTHFDREVRSGACLILIGQLSIEKVSRERRDLTKTILTDFGFLKSTITGVCKSEPKDRRKTQAAQFRIVNNFVANRYKNPYEQEPSYDSATNSLET